MKISNITELYHRLKNINSDSNKPIKNVWVVDDQETSQFVLTKIFSNIYGNSNKSKFSIQPTFFRSYDYFLDSFKLKEEDIDLLIFDFEVPPTTCYDFIINHFEVIKSIPCVVITSHRNSDIPDMLNTFSNVKAFVQKPFNFKDFLVICENIMSTES